MNDKPVALIVGGGSGIGADSARKLKEDGYDIAVMSSSGKGEALGNELGGLGFTGSNLVVADLEKFVALTMDRFNRIDAVVNCTGHGPKGPVMDISDEDWHLGMDVYLMNVIRITRIVLPIMQHQGNGSIVNISTFSVFEPDPDLSTVYQKKKIVWPVFQPVVMQKCESLLKQLPSLPLINQVISPAKIYALMAG